MRQSRAALHALAKDTVLCLKKKNLCRHCLFIHGHVSSTYIRMHVYTHPPTHPHTPFHTSPPPPTHRSYQPG
jgi:hypothetical protein